jgi:hypothetical protein
LKTYALVGRAGDAGGRYLASQHTQMKIAAWRMAQAGGMVQVWTTTRAGDLMKYDGDATRRVTDYIVKGRAALRNGLGGCNLTWRSNRVDSAGVFKTRDARGVGVHVNCAAGVQS